MELISREMAIDHIRVLGGEDRERLIGILNNKDILPTIESRPKGKWIDNRCSNCREFALQWGDESMAETEFCPHCGADMRGEE